MRNLLKTFAVLAAVIPALATAAIRNSRHDLSSGSTTPGPKSTVAGTDQTCIFCHTPHQAARQQLIWNRQDIAGTRGWTASTTLGGTALPADIQQASKVCLSCHDGTIGLGEVMNKGGGVSGLGAGAIPMTGAVSAGMRIGDGGAGNELATNHPVSVGYPTGARNSVLYAGVTQRADPAAFVDVAVACLSPTGICTTEATNGNLINLYGTAAQPGIECGSCHDVHNKYPLNPYFLRAPAAGSALCIACHIK